MLFYIKVIEVFLGALHLATHGTAISTCSRSLAYNSLCPNPMFVSGPNPELDVTVNLHQKSSPAGSSCDFVKGDNSNEVTHIGGFHVSDRPWPFIGAASCPHLIKFQLMTTPYRTWGGEKLCQKNLGIKVHDNVFLWHNYTLTSSKISFADIITNYGFSRSDLLCAHAKPKYLLILFLTSKHSKCSLMVQQYKLDSNGVGCDSLSGFGPFGTYRFCGEYPCFQMNSVILSLKLISQRPPQNPGRNVNNINSYFESRGGTGDVGKTSTTTESGHRQYKMFFELPTDDPELDEDESLDHSGPVEAKHKPTDWNEVIVKFSFPLMGVVFSVVVVYILHKRRQSEICNRQSIDQANHYISSTKIADKHGLPF